MPYVRAEEHGLHLDLPSLSDWDLSKHASQRTTSSHVPGGWSVAFGYDISELTV